jgi:uncharacterized protein YbaP (TraB family)
MRKSLFLCAALAAAIPAGAFAQSAPAQAPIQDWSVETVIVHAHVAGPAFWHIAKGNSEVWILGTVEPLPVGLNWNTRRLEQILMGAHAVILPPRAQVGIFEGVWFMMTDADVLRLPDGQKLEAGLPENLRKRFVAMRNMAHTDADRYETYKPTVAGLMLERDFLKNANLSGAEPQTTIGRLALARDVPMRPAATYPGLPLIKQLPSLSDESHRICLEAALDDIERKSIHAYAAAMAWADGDLQGVEANYSEVENFDGCLKQNNSFASLRERSIVDSVSAVDAALARPGKTVAIVNIGTLLRKNGLLDRLQAQGFTVEEP